MTEQQLRDQLQTEVKPIVLCIADVRQRLADGLDTISDLEVMEWLASLGVMLCEIAPKKEDSNLSRTLYEIAHKFTTTAQEAAETAEQLMTYKAFAVYRRDYIDTTVSMAEKLAVTLRRILDYRITRTRED